MNEGILANLEKKIRYFIKSFTLGQEKPTYISWRIFFLLPEL